MGSASEFNGRKMPRSQRKRPVRWCVALSREEAGMILDAAHKAGVSGSAWGRRALLRVAMLEGLAEEVEAAAQAGGGGVSEPRVRRRRR